MEDFRDLGVYRCMVCIKCFTRILYQDGVSGLMWLCGSIWLSGSMWDCISFTRSCARSIRTFLIRNLMTVDQHSHSKHRWSSVYGGSRKVGTCPQEQIGPKPQVPTLISEAKVGTWSETRQRESWNLYCRVKPIETSQSRVSSFREKTIYCTNQNCFFGYL